MSSLEQIIENTIKKPTIVNENSNFVVVTYWWGTGNYNNNTARPCISFYENIIHKLIELSVHTLNTSPGDDYTKNLNNLEFIVSKLSKFNNIVDNNSKTYINMIYEYLNIDIYRNNDIDQIALQQLEKFKSSGKTPQYYEYKNIETVKNIFKLLFIEIIKINRDNIHKLFELNKDLKKIHKGYDINKHILKNDINSRDINSQILIKIKNLTKEKNDIKLNIKKILNTPQASYSSFTEDKYNNKSINEIFNIEFRYLNPIKFEEMIQLWENKCTELKCNFLSVEYPEFAKPGGYQMAINAKPLFIKKTLELCSDHGLNVLYIDGDMYIRKYPIIFDLKDVDFMARGWWIDPRSSYKMTESILIDPYTFETSGGTMFFSQSNESKILLQKWIEESAKPYQKGKADDRILSLVFNTYKFLLNMKIIQLPIEYLWLTLDYDERMMDNIYDYDSFRMKSSIFIEHPECLTTEDTASGAGASSDRTPKFYNFLENIEPISEELHESIMFPNKEMTSAFRDYFEYMSNTTYINDGNPELIHKGFVDPVLDDLNLDADERSTENNEYPFYIIPFDDGMGIRKYPHDESLTIEEISKINLKRSQEMNIETLGLEYNDDNFVEIKNKDGTIDNKKMISLIIRLLNDGKNVIYNPVNLNDYNSEYYNKFKNENYKYNSMNFIFVPKFNKSFNLSDFFKPEIDFNQIIVFRPDENKILVRFLSMFLSFEELSNYINNGTYQIMSRLRISYLIIKKQKQQKYNISETTSEDFTTDNSSTFNSSNNGYSSDDSSIIEGGGSVSGGGYPGKNDNDNNNDNNNDNDKLSNFIDNYENGLDFMYKNNLSNNGGANGSFMKNNQNKSKNKRSKNKKTIKHKNHNGKKTIKNKRR